MDQYFRKGRRGLSSLSSLLPDESTALVPPQNAELTPSWKSNAALIRQQTFSCLDLEYLSLQKYEQ
jgi:hypothetical protein